MIFNGDWLLIPLILAGFATVAAAGESQPPEQSGLLSSLVKTAWRHNPAIAALAEEVDAGEARIAQSRAQLLPSATLNASYAANHTNAAADTAADEQYRYGTLQTSLRVPIFKPKAGQALKSSRLETTDLKLALRESKNNLAISVIDTVLQHIVLREEIHVLETQISSLETQVHINQRRLEGGLGSRTEVGETRLRLSLAQTQLDTRHSELNRLQIELTRQLGLEHFRLSAMAIKPDPDDIAPRDLPTATDTLLKHNISLLRASNKVALAQTNRQLQDRGHWPTLDLAASRVNNRYYGSSTPATEDDWSNRLTLEFELPLYAGGGITAQQKEANALWLKAQHDLQTSREGAVAELQQQFEARDLHLRRMVTNEAAMNQAQELLEMTSKAFAAGNRNNIDVLNAQQQVTDIGSELIKSRVDHLTVQAHIMALLGEVNLDILKRFDRGVTAM